MKRQDLRSENYGSKAGSCAGEIFGDSQSSGRAALNPGVGEAQATAYATLSELQLMGELTHRVGTLQVTLNI